MAKAQAVKSNLVVVRGFFKKLGGGQKPKPAARPQSSTMTNLKAAGSARPIAQAAAAGRQARAIALVAGGPAPCR
jgi:hypothetical protein